MATTVSSAFSEFMKNSVNLDSRVVSSARASRDNLLANIQEFADDSDFVRLCESFNVHFGSFARKTKCRELDDIDLMIGIAADGACYYEYDPWDNVRIIASTTNQMQRECTRDDGTLNSTIVLNRFKKKLEKVREYSRSEVKRNGEAVNLNLISKDWAFDIVPCFHTVEETDGRAYYLIPNGKGNWKKTDPTKDREHVTKINQENAGRVLEIVRLCKKWNRDQLSGRIPSYLLETMIIDFADLETNITSYLDLSFRDAVKYIADHITGSVFDMKDIQGDINDLSYGERLEIRDEALLAYSEACDAITAELTYEDQESAIKKWGEIFGDEFPNYG